MEGKDQDEEQTFRVSLDEKGAAKLAERLTDTLKDYMGEDFVDDTLVQYVIVLLGNGRRKEEVKEDLDVFLGDKSDSFVTWLWDHLATDLDQYVGSLESCPNEVAIAKPELDNTVKDDSSYTVTESDRGKPSKISRSRHNRDWKGLMNNDTQPTLRSAVTNRFRNEEKTNSNALYARQSVSPERSVHRKRNRDERSRPNKEVSQSTIAAPRRLLQFAVRDAVATTRPSNSVLEVSEPARKRLRSVVSASTVNLTDEVNHKRLTPSVRLPNPMSTAIKAVAEASKDVRRLRSGNVFDRLSRGDGSRDQMHIFEEPAVEDAEYDVCDHIHEIKRQRYLQTRDGVGRYHMKSMMGSSVCLASDSASDNEGYDDVSTRGVDDSEIGMSTKADDSLMVDYSVAQNSVEMTRQSRKKDQELPVSAANNKHKIVNISVNVNTWKPHHYQTSREMPKVEIPKSTLETDTGAINSNIQLTKENSNPVTVLGNVKPTMDFRKENEKSVGSSAPGPYSTSRPLEDADSRTIFVNNVHFAATKDTLSQHFNKFGEVLKVIILSDAATGHPKGSAYVEFMRKEAAENALTLDGTSFMSRIIKVVKKSSAPQEANLLTTWPRSTRGSPFSVPRFAQAPFPRIFPGAYRARPPIKLGMRSMQWKRDTQQTSMGSVASAPVNTTTAGRGLTYVRTDTKSDGKASIG